MVRKIRHIHEQEHNISMVPIAVAKKVMVNAYREFIKKYSYRELLPKRREPWRNRHLRELFNMRLQLGKQLGKYCISSSLRWKSYFALIETLAQCGMRSSECLVRKQSDWHPSDHLARSSLVWYIADKPVLSPTADQLANLTEQDYAILTPPPSKTDPFGVVWGDKPVYLPVRFSAEWCAALRLRDLELAKPLHGQERAQHPLFCDVDGSPLTYSVAYDILTEQKKLILTDEFDPSLFTFHSFRVYLATALGAVRTNDSTIQAICRWQSVKSLEVYKRLQPADVIGHLDAAQSAVITSYTSANLPTISSYTLSQEIRDQYDLGLTTQATRTPERTAEGTPN